MVFLFPPTHSVLDEGSYNYTKNQMTWYQARQHCQSLYTELASVSSEAENDKIFALLKSEAWIGLHRYPWSHWSDGSTATYWHWAVPQPDNYDGKQHCIYMTSVGFVDIGCGELCDFVCQERQKQGLTIWLKISSEADMMDPEVQRQILEQVGRVETRQQMEAHACLQHVASW